MAVKKEEIKAFVTVAKELVDKSESNIYSINHVIHTLINKGVDTVEKEFGEDVALTVDRGWWEVKNRANAVNRWLLKKEYITKSDKYIFRHKGQRGRGTPAFAFTKDIKKLILLKRTVEGEGELKRVRSKPLKYKICYTRSNPDNLCPLNALVKLSYSRIDIYKVKTNRVSSPNDPDAELVAWIDGYYLRHGDNKKVLGFTKGDRIRNLKAYLATLS